MFRLFYCLIYLVGCSTTSTSPKTSDLKISDEKRAAYEYYAPYCGGYPSKESCIDGDMALFSGLLCMSGDQRGCIGVRDSQGPDGRWWRSPRRIGNNLGKPNSFSRDMSLGVLAYLLHTKDKGAADRWMNWIERNRPCWVRIWGQCKVRGPHRLCKNDKDLRCSITPELWALFYDVWKHNGWSPTSTMRTYQNVPDMKITKDLKGYELHLKGVKEFLRKRMGKAKSSRINELVSQEPWNPFFRYLKEGPSASVQAAVEKVCPLTFPAQRSQWAWERRGFEEPWKKSMGWDCIFMSNLLN